MSHTDAVATTFESLLAQTQATIASRAIPAKTQMVPDVDEVSETFASLLDEIQTSGASSASLKNLLFYVVTHVPEVNRASCIARLAS